MDVLGMWLLGDDWPWLPPYGLRALFLVKPFPPFLAWPRQYTSASDLWSRLCDTEKGGKAFQQWQTYWRPNIRLCRFGATDVVEECRVVKARGTFIKSPFCPWCILAKTGSLLYPLKRHRTDLKWDTPQHGERRHMKPGIWDIIMRHVPVLGRQGNGQRGQQKYLGTHWH